MGVDEPDVPSAIRRLLSGGGVIRIPWKPEPYTTGLNWPGMDGLAYGGTATNPLVFEGVAGPNGERPVFNLPANLGAGLRVPGGLRNVHVTGLELRGGDSHSGLIIIQGGGTTGVVVEDCVLRGGAIGVMVNGMGGRCGRNYIRRNIIRDQRHPVSHSQAIYCVADDETWIEENVCFNNGSRNPFCHIMYLVHDSRSTRLVLDNWGSMPGSAFIQARGGRFIISGNVGTGFNTGIGVGHNMAWYGEGDPRNVWTDAYVADNFLADPRTGADAPAQWGFPLLMCRDVTYRRNRLHNIARPWMTSVDQGLSAPVGTFDRDESNIITSGPPAHAWEVLFDILTNRKMKQWREIDKTRWVLTTM